MKIDGQKLTKEQQAFILQDIDGQDFTREWEKARKGRAWGMGLTIGGSVATVGGGVAILGGAIIEALVVAIAAGTGAVVGSIGGEEAAADTANEAATNAAEGFESYYAACGAVMGAGIVSTAAGIPLLTINCRKMNKIVKRYNNQNVFSDGGLYFGPTASGGTGLAFVF